MERRPEPEDEPRGGFAGFVRWFARSRFHHMEQYLDELQRDPSEIDVQAVRARFLRATRHAQRVLGARLGVTVLLAFGVVTTAAATVANVVDVPSALRGDVDLLRAFLSRVAAYAGSATVLLLGLRLAFDRYVRQLETSATFLAMQLSAARGREAPPPGGA